MVYNFRFDREQRQETLRRLREQNLMSQGLGGGEKGGLDINQADFTEKCKNVYSLSSTRTPTNLSRIRNFKNDDLLVIPNLPNNREVSILVVDGDFPDCYNYLTSDPTHLNHQIRIKKAYGLKSEISTHNVKLAAWRGKLSSLRYRILPIPQFDSIFRDIIKEFDQNSDAKFEPSELDEYLHCLSSDVITLIEKRLSKLTSSGGGISFEEICKRLLISAGYQVVAQNQYNRSGGDIDFHCVRDLSEASLFETGQTTLFVQVKKHTGKTNKQGVEQLLKMIQDPTTNGCVMSLADFDGEAEKLAETEGIVLMNGATICQLLMSELSGIEL